ncbi:MAG TPA: PfkB family carbohydrate kinase [Gaiellaceae bacterium]
MRFAAVGDVMVDVVGSALPPPGVRVHSAMSVRVGGSAVNAARAAAEAGAAAVVVGRVGSDAAGALVLAELEALGIEATVERDPTLPTGAAVALGDDAIGPGVVAHRGANARFSPEDVPAPLEADALFLSGFALFQEGSSEAAQAALDRFTGGWAGIDLASPKLAAAATGLVGAAGYETVLLATAEEARAVTGEEPEQAARTLAGRFAIACIKLGADGALAAAGEHLERRAAEPVARTSPFGAGDAFGAALLVALARGEGLGPALEAACAAGARAAGA